MREVLQLEGHRKPVHGYLHEHELERLEAARRALEERWGRRVSLSSIVRSAVLRAVSELERAR